MASYCPDGKYLILIYSYSEIIKGPRDGWSSDDLWDSECEIGAYQDQVCEAGDMPLMQLLMIVDGGNMREFLSKEVVDLLTSVKGDKRAYDQPGSSNSSTKKPRLTT